MFGTCIYVYTPVHVYLKIPRKKMLMYANSVNCYCINNHYLAQPRVKLAYTRILPVLPPLYDDPISANEPLHLVSFFFILVSPNLSRVLSEVHTLKN